MNRGDRDNGDVRGVESSVIKELLEELGKKIIPTPLYALYPPLGIAVSALTFLTWLAVKEIKKMKNKPPQSILELTEDNLIELKMQIDKLEKELLIKKKALEKTTGINRRILEEEVKYTESDLKELEELYRIEHLRYMLWRKIIKTGNKELIKIAEKLNEDLRKGVEPTAEQLKLLTKLEEYRKKKILQEALFEKLLKDLNI